MDITEIIVAILVPLLSFIAASYATRSQMRQAEIQRASAERIAAAANNVDIARLKRELEAELWERARSEFAAERQARRELEMELEAERQARRDLAAAFESLRMRVAELEDENRRLRTDNVALASELSRYVRKK